MDTAVYKPGGDCKVYGVMAHVKIVNSSEVGDYVADGWIANPEALLSPIREQEPKKTRKPKAVVDENNDEG